jgi:hypothetical protein
LNLKKVLNADSFLAIFVIVLTLYTFRPIFTGQLIGDPFDSRLMIVIHEHWWRWLQGLTEFRDLGFFYPFDKALGFSDTFLVPGLLYSILRFFSFGLAESWIITTFTVLVIGNLGWVVVAKRFIKTSTIKILFVATIVLSFSFIAYFAINPNIVGYSLLSWFALLIYSIETEKVVSKKQLKIAVFIILFQLYALSFWYGAFFMGLIIFIRLLIGLIYSKDIGNFKDLLSIFQLNKKIWIVSTPVILFFTWIFLYVYLSVAGAPIRPKSEMIINSPSPLMLLNAGSPTQYGLQNSIFEGFYRFFGFDLPFENLIGFGFAVTLIGVVSMAILLFLEKRTIKLWILSILITYLYFTKLVNDVSIHGLLFETIPGINSIRYPARFIIILGFGLIFMSFKLIDNTIRKGNRQFLKVPLYLLLVIMLLDQIRGPFTGWDKKLLVNENLFSQAQEIKNNCDYFYFDHPGGWWYDQIEAITFSTQVGIPTVNGYSGAFPGGYPIQSWNSTFGSLKIFDWISQIDATKRGCFLSGISDFKILNSETTLIDFIGFTPKEKKGFDSWNWAVNEEPYLYVLSSTGSNLRLTFEIETSKCFTNQNIIIQDVSSNEIIQKVEVSSQEVVNIDLSFTESYLKQIQFSTDAGICRVEGDPRGLYFNIKNLKYE